MSETLLPNTLPPAPQVTALPEPESAAPSGPPPGVPAKFWNPETQEIRVDALLKSYLELERKLSETGRNGPPPTATDYAISVPNGLFEPDPDINQRLFEAGFSPDQAQVVYDLAAEYVLPLIREMAAEFQAERELERLVERFGGEAKWREISRQILAWARKEMPEPVVEALSSTEAGIIAMYQMMTSGGKPGEAINPGAIAARASGAGPSGNPDLDTMIRDPRYWRDKDPSFIAQVTDGFKRKYGA